MIQISKTTALPEADTYKHPPASYAPQHELFKKFPYCDKLGCKSHPFVAQYGITPGECRIKATRMRTIQVLSRGAAQHYKLDPRDVPWAAISIKDPDMPCAELHTTVVLHVSFVDMEPVDGMYVRHLMTPLQARQIRYFLEQEMPRNTAVLLINCERGIGRSASLAAAIGEQYGLDVERYKRSPYVFNKHVYNTMLSAYCDDPESTRRANSTG